MDLIIFKEGKADEKFLRDYIKFLFPSCNLSNITFKTWGDSKGNNRGNWQGCPANFEFIRKTETKVILFADADFFTKNEENGGFKKRCTYYENLKIRESINFEYFLFPNHSDDGTIENMFDAIKKLNFNICWNNMLECSKEIGKSVNREIKVPNLKGKMYAYSEIFSNSIKGIGNGKEENRNYNDSELWDLDSEYLKKLISFINKNILIKSL